MTFAIEEFWCKVLRGTTHRSGREVIANASARSWHGIVSCHKQRRFLMVHSASRVNHAIHIINTSMYKYMHTHAHIYIYIHIKLLKTVQIKITQRNHITKVCWWGWLLKTSLDKYVKNTKFKIVSHLPSQCTLTTSCMLHLHGPCCGMLRKLKGDKPSFESPKSVSFASQMGAGYTGWKKEISATGKKTYRNNYVYTYNVKQPFRTTCKIIVGWIWNCDRAKQNMVCPKKHTGYRFGWDWLDFRSQWSLLLVSSEHRTAGSRQPINLAATASIMPPYAHQDPPNTWS